MRLLLLPLLTFCSSKGLGDRTRFIYPESGEMIHVEELFGVLDFVWALGDDIPCGRQDLRRASEKITKCL